MRVSHAWLRELVDAPDAAAVAAALTQGGLEVEGIERLGPDLSEVRVGHVVERAHGPIQHLRDRAVVDHSSMKYSQKLRA